MTTISHNTCVLPQNLQIMVCTAAVCLDFSSFPLDGLQIYLCMSDVKIRDCDFLASLVLVLCNRFVFQMLPYWFNNKCSVHNRLLTTLCNCSRAHWCNQANDETL